MEEKITFVSLLLKQLTEEQSNNELEHFVQQKNIYWMLREILDIQ